MGRFSKEASRLGDSKLTNAILALICVSSLLPRKYGGFGNGKMNLNKNLFILDCGNRTDVYQYVDFIRQYGLDIKKTLRRIIISRAFSVHQLTDSIVCEAPIFIQKYNLNLIILLLIGIVLTKIVI